MQMAHVARRHLERGVDGLVEQPDRVVPLEARAQVVEDAPRLLDRSARTRATERKRRASASSSWMYSLYSLSVVAADHPNLAAREHRLEDVGGIRAARRAPSRRRPSCAPRRRTESGSARSFNLADDVLNPILEHAAQHRARDHRVHLQVDDLAVAQADRHRFGLELDAAREPSTIAVLPTPGSPISITELARSRWHENFEHLLDFLVAAEDGRHLVLPRQRGSGWWRSA